MKRSVSGSWRQASQEPAWRLSGLTSRSGTGAALMAPGPQTNPGPQTKKPPAMRTARTRRLVVLASVALALHALAQELAVAADRLGALAGPFLRWLLEVPAQLHLAEDPLALHLLLQGAQGLIDVVIADEN